MAHLASLFHFIILLALCGALGSLLLNFVFFAGLKASRPDPDAPLVSILVPARNEELNIGECVRSLLAQDYPFCEVIVLDDHSTDCTAEILRDLGLRDNGTVSRILAGRPLPSGWTGKSWACQQLAQEARGSYLFFTDADTSHTIGTVSALLAFAKRHNADLVSAWPRLVTVSWSEQLIVPLILLPVFTLYPHWLARLLQRYPALTRHIPPGPLRWLGLANGQSLFFRRAAYDRIGGHSAVRGDLVEDVALGRAVASRMGEGMRLFNCDAVHFSTCRMYRSIGQIWEGFSKNLWALFEDSAAGFLFMGGMIFGCYLLPFLLLFLPAVHRSTILGEILLIYVTRFALTLRFRTSWPGMALHPLGQFLALAIGVNSWRIGTAGRVTWKGRTYSGREARPVNDVKRLE